MSRTYEIVEKSREEANWGRNWSASFYLDVKTSSFTRQDEFYAYDIWDLTSGLGGLMGLFIGWSFLSIIFLMLGLADMLSTLSLYMPYTHLPSAVQARGVTSSQAASLISSLGVSSSLGRLLAGWLSDQAWAQPQQILAAAITAATPCLFLLAL